MSIDAENVSFAYHRTPVLDRLSLSIGDGTFVVFLGQNGSGKSTLLRILAGMLPCDSGSVRVDGKALHRLAPRLRASMLGFLPQHCKMVFAFSVEDVVMTGRASHVRLRPGRKDRMMVAEAMERTGIRHLRKCAFNEISGGEQQLVRIARLLSQAPRRILLDEPTTHLDLANQAKVLGLLKELSLSGISIVSVLHDPNTAFVYGDTFVFMKDGKAHTLGNGDNPWDEKILQRYYDVPLESVPHRGRALIAPVLPEHLAGNGEKTWNKE